jgi:putative membrane protein
MIEQQITLKHYIAFGFICLAVIIASIHPLEFESYLLHQAGTVLMLIALIIVIRKLVSISIVFAYTLLFIHSYCWCTLFIFIRTLQWWFQTLFHIDLNQTMGWSRNMYDRFVHFAYGLLLYPFFYRCFEFFFPKSKPVAIFLLVVQFVMASSLVYELIEWWIAIGLSPEAENYNGQQGDIWDAHKDMFLATLGSDFDWFTISI